MESIFFDKFYLRQPNQKQAKAINFDIKVIHSYHNLTNFNLFKPDQNLQKFYPNGSKYYLSSKLPF